MSRLTCATRFAALFDCRPAFLQIDVPIDTARRGGFIKAAVVDCAIVDTTVMPKAIAHPTDSFLLEKSRQHLVKVAKVHSMVLLQNYNRVLEQMAILADHKQTTAFVDKDC